MGISRLSDSGINILVQKVESKREREREKEREKERGRERDGVNK